MSWPWSVLGLEGEVSERDLKRAYAKRLKAIDQKADPKAFIALREAYEVARNIARSSARSNSFQPIAAEPEPKPKPSKPAPKQAEPAAHAPPIEQPEHKGGPEPVAESGEAKPSPHPDEPSPAPEADPVPEDHQPDDQQDTPPDDASGMAPEGMADDLDPNSDAAWAKADECSSTAAALIQKGDFGEDVWRELLFDPSLDLPGAIDDFEYVIVDTLADRFGPAYNFFRATPGWVRLIEQRFAWSSDGLRFLQRHPNAIRLRTRFQKLINFNKEEGLAPFARKTQPTQVTVEPAPFYFRWWFVIVVYIILWSIYGAVR